MKTLITIRRIIFVIIILNLLAIPAIALYEANTEWDGTCIGFSGGPWSCSQSEYATNEMINIALALILPLGCFGTLWIALTIVFFVIKRGEKDHELYP